MIHIGINVEHVIHINIEYLIQLLINVYVKVIIISKVEIKQLVRYALMLLLIAKFASIRLIVSLVYRGILLTLYLPAIRIVLLVHLLVLNVLALRPIVVIAMQVDSLIPQLAHVIVWLVTTLLGQQLAAHAIQF